MSYNDWVPGSSCFDGLTRPKGTGATQNWDGSSYSGFGSAPGQATTPAAPTGVAATSGANASSVITWTDGSDGGSAVTSYNVVSIPATTTQHFSSGGTFTGLTNGTSYTFKVTAVNAVGTGAQSAASAAATPYTVPGAPTGATAVAGDTTAVVSWTAPVSTGGSAITGYLVSSSPATTTQALASGGTFTGLTNGVAYTFTVVATNAAGNSAASAASNSVTPAAAFTLPTNTLLTANQTTDIRNWLFSSGLTSSLLNATDYLGNANAANTLLTNGTTGGEKYWWGNSLASGPAGFAGVAFGILVKRGAGSAGPFFGIDQNTSTDYTIFDLSLGTVATNAGIAVGRIVNVGGGWFYCEYNARVGTTQNNSNFRVRFADTAANCVPGGGGSNFQSAGSSLIVVPCTSYAPSTFLPVNTGLPNTDPTSGFPWGTTEGLTFAQNFTAPNGALGYTGTNANSSGFHTVTTGNAGVAKTKLSFAAKAGTNQWAFTNQGGLGSWSIFNLGTGAVDSVGGGNAPTATILSLGGGWYWCETVYPAAIQNVGIGLADTRTHAFDSTQGNRFTPTTPGDAQFYNFATY